MIDLNSVKNQIKTIIEEINNSVNQGISNQNTLSSIQQLKTSITNDYDALMNLPQEQKSKIMDLYNNLSEVEYSTYRYNELLKANLTKEAQAEANVITQLQENLINNFNNNTVKQVVKTGKTNMDASTSIQEVLDFLQNHIQKVGTQQAVKDFQRGLNILNKYNKKSPIEAKRPIDEDGILGNQTYTCLSNVCKNYTPRIIQKYVRRGAVNNVVFDTKNDKRVDTDKKAINICNNLIKGEK